MDRIGIAKTLLKRIGANSIEEDRVIALGVVKVLDGVIEQPEQNIGQLETTYKTIDVGKIRALRRAGWSVAKIAEELCVSDLTVRKYMMREGIA